MLPRAIAAAPDVHDVTVMVHHMTLAIVEAVVSIDHDSRRRDGFRGAGIAKRGLQTGPERSPSLGSLRPYPDGAADMSSCVLFLLMFVIATATGCDPRVYLHVRAPLRPTPSVECLGSALTASPQVLKVTHIADDRREGFLLLLRDSTAEHGQREASIDRAAPPDSGKAVELSFVWIGLSHPPAAEERTVTELAGRVLRQIRAACPSELTGAIECVYIDGRRAGTCPSAG